jgi:hypothetical protein
LFKNFDSSKQSLNDHIIQLTSDQDVIIKKQSLDERFNKSSVEFIKQVLIEQLHTYNKLQHLPLLDSFRGVYLQDSTKFKLPHSFKSKYPGYHQAGASIQLTLDIKQNSFNSISIHPQTYNDVRESENVKWLPKDSLLIRDLGYFSMRGFKAVQQNQSYFLSRLQPKSALFEYKNDNYIRFDMNKLLKRMRKYNLPYSDQYLYLGHEHKFPLRVCFFLVSKSLRTKRLKEKNYYVKNRGWKQSRQYTVWTWFNAYITNADKEMMPSHAIVDIYRYRWQIELVFKTWKSNYHIEKMKSMKAERMECYLYALLLKATLHRNIMNLCSQGIKGKQGISFLKFTKLVIALDKKIYSMMLKSAQAIENFIATLDKLNKYIIMKEIKKKPSIFTLPVSKAQLTSSRTMGILKI